MPTEPLQVIDYGMINYPDLWRKMQDFTDQRSISCTDQLWLAQHPAIFTLGQAGKLEHILDPHDIPVLHVDRGGQVTYHGPGQLLIYPLIDLRRKTYNVRQYVHHLEEIIISVLARYQINAERRDKAPGVYVECKKIASLGIRIRRGCSFHGIALNICMDLTPFSYINPCGYQGLEITQISDLAGPKDVNKIANDVMSTLEKHLDYTVELSS